MDAPQITQINRLNSRGYLEIARAAIRNSFPFLVYQQGNIGLKEEIEYFPKVYSIDFATQRVNRLSKIYVMTSFKRKKCIPLCRFSASLYSLASKDVDALPDQTENDV